jgi:hypothetical protein
LRAISSNGKRIRRPEPYVCGKDTPSQPGDEQSGGWSREHLLKMDEKFIRAVERAFETDSEHRQSAATNGVDSTRPRYR